MLAVSGPGDEVVYAWRSFEAYPWLVARRRRHPRRRCRSPTTRATTCRRWPRPSPTARARSSCAARTTRPAPIVDARRVRRSSSHRVPTDVLVILDEAYASSSPIPSRSTACGCSASRATRTSSCCAPSRRRSGSPGSGSATPSATPASSTPPAAPSIPLSVTAQAEEAALASLAAEYELLRARAPHRRPARRASPQGSARPAGAFPTRRATSSGCRPAPSTLAARRGVRRGGPHRAPVRRRRHAHLGGRGGVCREGPTRSRHPLSRPSQKPIPASGVSVGRDAVRHDPALVRVLAADGSLAPTRPPPSRTSPIIEALSDADLERFYRDMARHPRLRPAGDATCSGRGSWPSGRRASARRPRRSGPPAPPARRTTSSPPTASTSSRASAASTCVDIIRVMRGLTHGGWNPFDPKNGNTHIYTLVLGSQTLHATGLAMGIGVRRPMRHGRPGARRSRHRLLRRRRLQPGRRARGDGVRRQLPHARGVLPAEQPVGDLGARLDAVALAAATAAARGYGIPSIQVDGNDVLASYAVTARRPRRGARRATARARSRR